MNIQSVIVDWSQWLMQEINRELKDIEDILGLNLQESEIQLLLTESEYYVLSKELIMDKLRRINDLTTRLACSNTQYPTTIDERAT
jgi:hypothetical protein